MPLRPFRLRTDTAVLVAVLPRAFQYPEHPEWSLETDQMEGLVDSLTAMRGLWPVLAVLQVVFPFARDMLRGFVWEEDGQPVGVVNVLRRGASENWIIGNVAVLPDFRRRGIARQLVQAAVDLALSQGARQIVLDVVVGNVPARALYESLGFEAYSGSVEMACNPCKEGVLPPDRLVPEGYMLGPMERWDWQTRLALRQRITPGVVKHYEPLDPRQMRPPLAVRPLVPLFERLSGTQSRYFVVRTLNGTPVASAHVTARTRPGGTNQIEVVSDPEHPAPVEALLCTLLREAQWTAPGRRTEMIVSAWQPAVVEAAEALGFERRCTYDRMGLKV